MPAASATLWPAVAARVHGCSPSALAQPEPRGGATGTNRGPQFIARTFQLTWRLVHILVQNDTLRARVDMGYRLRTALSKTPGTAAKSWALKKKELHAKCTYSQHGNIPSLLGIVIASRPQISNCTRVFFFSFSSNSAIA